MPIDGEERGVSEHEPVMNPRILVTYEVTSSRGYHDSAADLEDAVDGWLFGAMEDREARMTEVSCFHLPPVEDDPDD